MVIGGAGGIGEVWSQFMMENYRAQIIWIGRRKKDDAIQAKLDRYPNLALLLTIFRRMQRNAESLQELPIKRLN